jgi:FMN-dependent NADH-azoreductase
MTSILHVASSSNLQGSLSRQVGAQAVAKLASRHSGARVIERDLVKTPLPHLSPEFLGAMFAGKNDAPELQLSEQLIGELLGSDVLVIEAPMYNFGIPSALKAWIDHVVRAGRTFQYGANGPEGLAKGKKAVLVLSRGGVYSAGPYKAMDYQETYLRAVLGFIGITDVESIHIEGVAMGPDKTAAAMESARQSVEHLLEAA